MKNKTRLVLYVTPQTAQHIREWAAVCGCYEGRIIDKLVRDRARTLKIERKSK